MILAREWDPACNELMNRSLPRIAVINDIIDSTPHEPRGGWIVQRRNLVGRRTSQEHQTSNCHFLRFWRQYTVLAKSARERKLPVTLYTVRS